MRLTITQLPDKIEEFEVSDSLELGDLRALLELNVHNAQYQQQQQQQQVATSSSGLSPQMEAHRQQVLQNPQLMEQLRQTHPEIAQAVQNNPSEFARLMGVLQQQQRAIQNERQRELANLEADPFDVESQRRIEEMIRQENVMKNMETALELNPESFASVSMLYISVIVNGTPIKALVDSGAQATIMSHSCAERCGIMRLIDTRFAGEARG
ncbi:DNA damage-inducible protein 1, partial [Kickxella alabastrina]